MGRLRADLLERFEDFAARIVKLAQALEKQRRSRRFVDQLAAAGTSTGANLFEADEAMSRGDFIKELAIVSKELNETRFWLGLIVRCGWLTPSRLAPLQAECDELRKVTGSMIARSKRRAPRNTA